MTGLSKLRTQLTIAVKVRVDPTEKYTRPLVEYCQSCTDCHELSSLWDYQTSVKHHSCIDLDDRDTNLLM